MGLAFLNKKSWHTGSFQNIEKVWIAEMKDQEETRLMKEAQRRLKEEQHYEELKRLQVEAGLIPKSHLQRLDWMYQGGSIKNTSSEEYLLGRPVTKNEPLIEEWRPTLCKESTANPNNEIFTKVHEDPLFVILQEEQRRRKDILGNPQKMIELKKEIEKMKKGKKHKKNREDKYKGDDSTKESKKKEYKKCAKAKEESVEKYAPSWFAKKNNI